MTPHTHTHFYDGDTIVSSSSSSSSLSEKLFVVVGSKSSNKSDDRSPPKNERVANHSSDAFYFSLSLSLSLGFDENNTAKEEEQFLGSEGKFSSPNKKEVFLF